MARIVKPPRSCERLHHVRARLRKASCMTDDAHDDLSHSDEDSGDDNNDSNKPRPAHPVMRAPSQQSAPASDAQDAPSSSGTPELAPRAVHIKDADPQTQSAFFARLPPEVRRMIYTHVWRLSNPTLALHIHAACDGARLTHTPCCTSCSLSSCSPSVQQQQRAAAAEEEAEEDDPMRTDPWPGWRGRNQPPRWFWHAWGLRMRWGSPHWKCQAEAMLSWRAKADGTCADERGLRGNGYLPVFLTSRRVYAEAIESFLESTTLIFTASEDAYRFFVQQPHPYHAKVRSVHLAFTHFKDHLFLQRIEPRHPRLPDSQLSVPVSWGVWTPLMRCVRGGLPELRRLTVHLSAAAAPTSREEVFLDVLREWADEGYGMVEEKGGGLVYTETGRLH
ncbi:hypothetical protein J7T55_011049 [Diaporthe amygdali]|uniref:uncharacterized protein n=1 Tax=Phomopsis amygdali TaxID=1214568 RepID=UPI0022FDF3D0|nr:uncharacterized protein J7T55_011049 [Diaporthe amygdali]KAJ0106954.1 hypothetical protein J7T55_011049 [Diaporthe amygdali]